MTAWVLSTVAALTALLLLVILNASSPLRRTWQSPFAQLDWIGHGARVGSFADVLVVAVGVFMLLLTVAGITFTYLLLFAGSAPRSRSGGLESTSIPQRATETKILTAVDFGSPPR